MRPPSHRHRCQGGCGRMTPCPVRSRDRQQWCEALLDARLHVCLGCTIRAWMAGATPAPTREP